jgi:hypothetical protein
MKHLVTLFMFVLLLVVNINSQPLFVETFNYNDGALMTMVGLNTGSPYYAIASVSNNVSGGVWTPGSTSTFDDPMMVESGALTYPGYSLSGEGKKLFCPNLAPNSSNNRGFATFSSQQTVYYSMMINMKDVTGISAYPSTNGEYFTGLWATGNATNANYRGLLVFRGGINPAKFQLGVRACQPTTVATTWVDVDLDVLTTYLVVVKYERNNPTCKASLWINPSLAGPEPTPDAINNYGAVDPVTSNTDVARFGIYQRGSRPHVWVGGIYVSSTGFPPGLIASVRAILEGPFNGTLMDNSVYPLTVTAKLYDAGTNALVDSKTGDLSTAGVGTFNFTNASNGTPYYIAIKSSNTLETQSATGQSFTMGSLNYDFTTGLAQAYTDGGGIDPMLLKGGKWCIYSGDVNQDGGVDIFDLSPVDNDNTAGGTPGVPSGLPTDVNGDGGTDIFDLSIVDNNNSRGAYAQLTFSPAANHVTHQEKSQVKNIK